MIIQEFDCDEWKFIILYSVNKTDFKHIYKILYASDCPDEVIEEIKDNLYNNNKDNGFTYTSYINKLSIIAIGEVSQGSQLCNTIAHECYHLTQKLSRIYNWDEETSAIFIGNFIQMVCESQINLYNDL